MRICMFCLIYLILLPNLRHQPKLPNLPNSKKIRFQLLEITFFTGLRELGRCCQKQPYVTNKRIICFIYYYKGKHIYVCLTRISFYLLQIN